MMFLMTRQAKNFQVLNVIVLSILIFMMHFKFTFNFMTSIASFLVMIKSKFSIARNSIFIRRMIFKDGLNSFLGIKSSNFYVHALSRTMNPMFFTRSNKKNNVAFLANFFKFSSSIVFVKTRFAAKNTSVIVRTYIKNITTMFATFRFPSFTTRGEITLFRAENLPLIIAMKSLITLFTNHVDDSIRNTLTSQSYRRNYG